MIQLYWKIKMDSGHVYDLGFFSSSVNVIKAHRDLFALKSDGVVSFRLISCPD